MLGCLRRFFDMAAAEKGVTLDLASIPQDDPVVYDMICRADTVGVFQIESRAQMSMLPRLKPRTLDDLTIEVAVVRPGPIQGQMVHPYLRRREGTEPVDYPTAAFKRVLERTLGIPLFQEQAMAIAIHCAGFTAGEADQLRRSMATFKFTGGVRHFKEKLVAGMITNKYSPAFAETTFSQLEGFGSYGFPMSHAASFAIIAYASAWAKHHHPDIFLAAILNAQPMGFYPAAQLIADARRHGVEVRPVDVNHSRWDCTLEGSGPGPRPVRLGLRLVAGLGEAEAAKLVGARCEPYADMADLHRRSRIGIGALTRLAEADAFGSFGLSRREAAWAIRVLRDTVLPLFEAADTGAGQIIPEMPEPIFALKPARAGREVVDDYAALGFSLKAHPVAFLREGLDRRGALRAADLTLVKDGRRVRVAGLVLVRQRPGSAKGVMFITLEDETGSANLIIWPSLLDRFRRVVFTAGMMGVEGKLQREGEVIHVIAERLVDLSAALAKVGTRDAMTVPHKCHDPMRDGGSDGCRLAIALNLRTKEDFNPNLRVVPERGIVMRPRNFR
jgi:error-prone DNA polymerase